MKTERNLDMTLTLDEKGAADMTYTDLTSGEDYHYRFHFTGDLGDDRKAQALTIGYEILSWFDIMKARLENKEE